MKAQERLLRIIKGLEYDRPAWSPFLAYWWEMKEKDYQRKGEIKALLEMGADPLIRGHIPLDSQPGRDLFVFDTVRWGYEIRETICGNKKQVCYETRVGSLTAEYKMTGGSSTWFLSSHPVKCSEDYNILQFICENTKLIPDGSIYKRLNEDAGGEALLAPLLVPFGKSDFQSLIEYWVGTEEMAYALMDEPELVEETLEVMGRLSGQAVRICADSEAEVFISWEDSSTTNYSPYQYEQYILPQINQWCRVLHGHQKYYIQHACGHLAALAPAFRRSKIDCLESVSPPPTGNIGLEELCSRIEKDITYIGGIEPVFFLNASLEELEMEALRLMKCMEGRRFILANSDSCPPGIGLDKFRAVGRLMDGVKQRWRN